MDSINTKLQVNNLPPQLSVQDLKDYFAQYGPVVEVIMINDNTAVVEYEDLSDTKYALQIGEGIIRGKRVFFEKYYETTEELNIRDMFRGNLQKWENMLKQFFPRVKASVVILSNVFPEEFMKNGTGIHIHVTLVYENLSADNLIKLVYDPTDYGKKMKIMLNQQNDFGYYNVNILYIAKESINIDPHNKNTKVGIIIRGELIQSDDYYGTIGAYRITWQNICEKEKFSKKELIKLAEDLNLNYNQADDLCHIIGERVNNLLWDDFEDEEN
jgi:hypothetical protein